MQNMRWSMAMARTGPLDVQFDLVLWSPESDKRVEGRANAGLVDLLRIEVWITPRGMNDALASRVLTAMFHHMEKQPRECSDLAGEWIDLKAWLQQALCERDFQQAFHILSSDYKHFLSPQAVA